MATGTILGGVASFPTQGQWEYIQLDTGTDLLTLTQATASGNQGDIVVWRTSAGTELGSISSQGEIMLRDSVAVGFGSLATTAGDVEFSFDGTNLLTVPSTANTRWDMGDTTAGLDVRFVSSRLGGGAYVQWDASEGRMLFRRSVAGSRALLNLLGTGLTTAGTVPTTVQTTGFQKGDLFLIGSSATMLRLGVCFSAATNAVQYTNRFSLAAGSAT